MDSLLSPTEMGTAAPSFWPIMSIVAKRSPISATVELFFLVSVVASADQPEIQNTIVSM